MCKSVKILRSFHTYYRYEKVKVSSRAVSFFSVVTKRKGQTDFTDKLLFSSISSHRNSDALGCSCVTVGSKSSYM
jgi:hypothetical protein